MSSLKDKTVGGMFWSFLQKVGGKGISFAIMIVLARLLTPKDFGLVGLMMIFIQISQVLIEGGFNLALIQKKDTDEEDYSSVFYINLILSIFLYIILFIAAPYISDFYEQPILIQLIRSFSIVFIINAFSYVQEARLTKEVRFKTLMFIHIPSTLMGGIISVIMAFNGFGVWSIIFLQLVTRLAYSIQIWIYAKWVPLFYFNLKKATLLFSFGGKLLISNIINIIYNNIFLVIIGKFYSLSNVGFYQNASNLAYTPSATITNVLSSVSFPIFSSIQDNNTRLKEGYKKVMQQAFFWICPAYMLAAVLATPLFLFVFTEKWLAAVPYFQLLCVGAILQPLYVYNLNILNVKGRSDKFLKLETMRRGIILVALVVVFPFGIWGLLIVQALGEIFTYLLFAYSSGKFIDYNLKEQVIDLLPILLLSIGVSVMVFITELVLKGVSNLLLIILGFSFGCILYWGIAKFLKISAYNEFELIIKKKMINPVLLKISKTS
jgi:O-antigen/teichoic acid export membrane protein